MIILYLEIPLAHISSFLNTTLIILLVNESTSRETTALSDLSPDKYTLEEDDILYSSPS